MKRYILLCLVVISLIACKNQKSEPVSPETQMDSNLVILKYKVGGLSDSLMIDSVFKMKFEIQAIENIYFNKKDSTIIVKVDQSQITPSDIIAEIKNRGIQIIERLN